MRRIKRCQYEFPERDCEGDNQCDQPATRADWCEHHYTIMEDENARTRALLRDMLLAGEKLEQQKEIERTMDETYVITIAQLDTLREMTTRLQRESDKPSADLDQLAYVRQQIELIVSTCESAPIVEEDLSDDDDNDEEENA